jgi:hypothetical protein
LKLDFSDTNPQKRSSETNLNTEKYTFSC